MKVLSLSRTGVYLTMSLNIRKTRDTVAVIHVSVVVMASLD
jgi:hypothetical protein